MRSGVAISRSAAACPSAIAAAAASPVRSSASPSARSPSAVSSSRPATQPHSTQPADSARSRTGCMRAHGPCLGRRLVAERPERAHAGHRSGPQGRDKPVQRPGRRLDVALDGIGAAGHVPGDLERERLARARVAGERDQGEEIGRGGSFLHGIGRIARRWLPRCCLVLPMVCHDTLATGSCPRPAPGSPGDS